MTQKLLNYVSAVCFLILALMQVFGCNNLWWYPSDLAGIMRFAGCITISAAIIWKKTPVELIGAFVLVLSGLISLVTVVIAFGPDLRLIYIIPELLGLLAFTAYAIVIWCNDARLVFLGGVAVGSIIISLVVKMEMVDLRLSGTFLLALVLFSAVFIIKCIGIAEYYDEISASSSPKSEEVKEFQSFVEKKFPYILFSPIYHRFFFYEQKYYGEKLAASYRKLFSSIRDDEYTSSGDRLFEYHYYFSSEMFPTSWTICSIYGKERAEELLDEYIGQTGEKVVSTDEITALLAKINAQLGTEYMQIKSALEAIRKGKYLCNVITYNRTASTYYKRRLINRAIHRAYRDQYKREKWTEVDIDL